MQVIHLVTEESIEHRMLGILAGKQTLAEALEGGLLSLARLAGIDDGEGALDLGPRLEARFGQLAVDGAGFAGFLRAMPAQVATAQADTREWVERGAAHLRRIEETLDRAALGGAAG